MAICLYTHGKTHTVRGYKCTLERFDANQLHQMLAQGWVRNPSELYEEPDNSPVNDEPVLEAKEENTDLEFTDEEIKLIAKKNGISLRGKKIETIKNELKALGEL